MTFVIIVPGPDDLCVFLRPPDESLRRLCRIRSPQDFWRHLPVYSGLYVVVLAGGDLLSTFTQLVGDYYDVIHVPGRWLRHLPRSARYKRASLALRLALNHRLAPLRDRPRNYLHAQWW